MHPHEVEEVRAITSPEAALYPDVDPDTHAVTFRPLRGVPEPPPPICAPQDNLLNWAWGFFAACAASALIGVLVGCWINR